MYIYKKGLLYNQKIKMYILKKQNVKNVNKKINDSND